MHSFLIVPPGAAPQARPSVPRFSASWRVGLALVLGAVAWLTPVARAQVFLAEWTASANGGMAPTGVALATEGGTTFLYVCDHTGNRIIKFNATTGAVVTTLGTAGSGNGQFNAPYGVTVDPASGHLYVVERGNHRVQRITNTGAFVMAWGSLGSAVGQFNEPINLAIDSAGAVYVTEHTNHRVQKFTVAQTGGTWAATPVTQWGTQGSGTGQFNTPYGIAIDSAGSIYVADGFNGRVQKFSSAGAFQAVVGAPGTAAGQFLVPTGLALDSAGALYVTSTNQNPQDAAAANASSQWVSKFSGAGVFQSRFGGAYGSATGQFRLPFFIAVGGTRAYVSDYYNGRIQVFDLSATSTPGPDTTAPTVSSFTITGSTATSVTYQITFSEAVTGVERTDFTAAVTGAATATVGTVTGTGATYTIPVTLTGATGTVQLNLNAAGTGIVDAASNAIAAGATGPTHTLGTTSTDTTAPTVATFTVASSTATSASFQIVFSEAVTGVDAADFTAVAATGATATIGAVSGSGTTYTIPVTFTGTGTVQLNLKATGTGIADASGNAIAAGATGPTHTIGSTGGGGGGGTPGTAVVSATVPANRTYTKNDRLLITVTFSGPVRVPSDDDDDDDDDADDDEDGSKPYITWTAVSGTSNGQFRYKSGNGTATLTFEYKVQNHDRAPAGIQLGTAIQVRNGSIRDSRGGALTAQNLALTWAQNPLTGVLINADSNGNGNSGNGNSGNGNSGKGNSGNGNGNGNGATVIRPVPGVGVGDSVTLPSTTTSGAPITWVLVSGNATLNGNVLTPTNRGAVVVRAVPAGAAPTAPATAEFAIDARERTRDRLANLSSRLRVTGGDANRSVIAGFVVTGLTTKQVLVRAVGPGLRSFGIGDALANPRLIIRDSSGAIVAENEGWNDSAAISAAADKVGAFKLNPGSRDAAALVSLPPGTYTAQVTANGNGVTLVEVYDATDGATLTTEQIVNISTRGFVDTGEGQLVAGFVIAGNAPKRVLIRGIGPALTAFGVTGAVADPVLKLYASGRTSPVAQNDNWETAQPVTGGATPATAAEITAAGTATGAFPFATGSKDAAILVTLPPGAYSAVMSGAADSTGAGLVEVYELPAP